jgi:hypothetical protein
MYNVNKPRAFLQTTEGKDDPKTCQVVATRVYTTL